MSVICVGDLCCDLIVPYGGMRAALARGDFSKKTADSMLVRMQCGGSVANVARNIGKLSDPESRPLFITPLKLDELGLYLEGEMEKAGVDMSGAVPCDRSNMYCIAVLDESGERTMFCFVPPWADYPHFTADSFRNAPKAERGDIVFTSGMAFLDDAANNAAVLTFFKEQKEHGATVIFDLNVRAESYGYAGERKASMEQMIAMSDLVLGSGSDEFSQVTGHPGQMAAAEVLMDRMCGKDRSGRPKTVIARDGADPILVMSSSGQQRDTWIPVRPVKPVSTLGAGDAFDGAFIHALSGGSTVQEATRAASDYAGRVISGQA